MELLKKMDIRISNLEEGQKYIKTELSGTNKKLDELKEVEEVTKVNCYEIVKLKIIK